MKKVTGIGGIFFKSLDPEKLKKWYADHLGIDAGKYGYNFIWSEGESEGKQGQTVWNPFSATTKYFEPSKMPFMINYRVDDLVALAAELKSAGVTFVDDLQDSPFGKFLHILDLEGNKLELWEPASE